MAPLTQSHPSFKESKERGLFLLIDKRPLKIKPIKNRKVPATVGRHAHTKEDAITKKKNSIGSCKAFKIVNYKRINSKNH